MCAQCESSRSCRRRWAVGGGCIWNATVLYGESAIYLDNRICAAKSRAASIAEQGVELSGNRIAATAHKAFEVVECGAPFPTSAEEGEARWLGFCLVDVRICAVHAVKTSLLLLLLLRSTRLELWTLAPTLLRVTNSSEIPLRLGNSSRHSSFIDPLPAIFYTLNSDCQPLCRCSCEPSPLPKRLRCRAARRQESGTSQRKSWGCGLVRVLHSRL